MYIFAKVRLIENICMYLEKKMECIELFLALPVSYW